MSEKDNGGPAFPLKDPLMSDWSGMTMRDYFAAKAMQGMNANPEFSGMSAGRIADFAYEQADAMLLARGN